MKTIWKFPLKAAESQIVSLPKEAKILCIQAQFEDTPTIWALVNSDNELEERIIEVYDTGHNISIDKNLNYIGTFQIANGTLVFHAFERN